MSRSRFQAPHKISSFDEVQQALAQIQADLDATTRNRAQLKVYTQDFAAVAGGFHRVSSLAAGLDVRMPKAGPANLGDAVILHLEDLQGDVAIWAAPGDTINGEATATFSVDGVVTLWSNGVNSWSGVAQTPAESPSGEALDAEYVLGSAHPSLPNGIVPSAARQVPVVNDAGTDVAWGFPIEAQQDDVDLGNVHTVNAEGQIRGSLSSGVMTLTVAPTAHGVTETRTGVQKLTLPAAFRSGDIVDITYNTAGASIVYNEIELFGGATPSDGTALYLTLVNVDDTTPGSITLRPSNVSDLALRTLGGGAGGGGGDLASGDYVMQSEEECSLLIYSANRWRQRLRSAPAPVTGAVAIVGGNSSNITSTFSGIQDNGTAETAQTNVNFVSSTSNTLTVAQDAGNSRMNVTAERAALTGFAAAAANSNATTSAEPIITYSTSSNTSAERVLSDGIGTVIDTATAGQIKVNLTTVDGTSPIQAKRVTFSATGATGTLIDVNIWTANSPWLMRILWAELLITTAVGGTTAALRTATGGGGTVVLPDVTAGTQTFSTAAAVRTRDNANATFLQNAGSTLQLRIDRAIAGELILYVRG